MTNGQGGKVGLANWDDVSEASQEYSANIGRELLLKTTYTLEKVSSSCIMSDVIKSNI